MSERHRVSDLLFEWETRHLGPAGRTIAEWWRRPRGAVLMLVMVAGLTTLGATGVLVRPQVGAAATESVEDQLRSARSALQARQGELELARLELNRLQTIVEHSAENRIPADLAAAIYDIAVTEGVDPTLAFSLVRVESSFTRRAISSAGAVGFTQVMPSTAFWLQPGISYDELFDRDTNLRLGFRYLRMMVQQYRGDLNLALLAYNRGPTRVDDILRGGGDPSNGYARLVRGGITRETSE